MLSKNTYFRQFLVFFSQKLSEILGMIMKGEFEKIQEIVFFIVRKKKFTGKNTRTHNDLKKLCDARVSKKRSSGIDSGNVKKHVFVLNHGTSENAPSHRYTAGVLRFLAYC